MCSILVPVFFFTKRLFVFLRKIGTGVCKNNIANLSAEGGAKQNRVSVANHFAELNKNRESACWHAGLWQNNIAKLPAEGGSEKILFSLLKMNK